MSSNENSPADLLAGTTGLEIAVVGMSGRFPGAPDLETFWRNLREGVESVTFFSEEELLAAGVAPEVLDDPKYVRARAVFPEEPGAFDAGLFGYSPRDAEIIDPQHRIFLECAWAAMEDAGTTAESFRRPVGVYGGVSEPWYFLSQIYPSPEVLASVGFFPAMIGSSREFLTTRVSYKLDLGGPSVTVQSACSTSLVAIHAACQALLAGECDLALAGGVAVRTPRISGYVYQEGGVVSSDGHCRSFDADAEGTVSGDGVGVVVLMRLEDAVAEGHTIRAVIRGTAVNNDAGHRVGYTAPAVAGQASVIRAALGAAEVPPASVQYVETHGSATALGDPTEVEALAEAYRGAAEDLAELEAEEMGTGADGLDSIDPQAYLPATGSVAIGSVKSNIGHCDSAAGVAGFLKTVLALEHGELPPSLNFSTPNPQIDFSSLPFYVNTETRPWHANGTPRRAGVSSFGMGGTNAHVVIEEAPEPAASSEPRRPRQLVALSAQTPEALERVSERFLAWLEARVEDTPKEESARVLADAAHTLRVGRKGLPARRVLVARDLEDAARVLRERDPKRMTSGSTGGAKGREVVYLLSGVGEQHVGMARQLYDVEPVFRDAFDACCEALREPLGLDLREVLFPPESETKGDDSRETGADGELDLRAMMKRARAAREGTDERLSRTLVIQPAVFAAGYATARLLESWGVRPKAMIGYSLGEYLAACLAGVLSLEDALSLVAERARLLDSLPEGAMLAVPLPAAEAETYLGERLSLAATNAPNLSVIAGPSDAIAELEAKLEEAGQASRRLATSHAFHSTMMDPIADDFRAVVAKHRLRAPETPYLSNVTGEWITAEQATDPDYYVRHLRGTVRFSEAVTLLLDEPGAAVVEVGPGRALATFARQHRDTDRGRSIVDTLRQEGDPGTDVDYLLTTLGRLWTAGVDVDWPAFVDGETRRRLPLPTYPFDHSQVYFLRGSGRAGFLTAGAVPLEGGGENAAEGSGGELAGTAPASTAATAAPPAFKGYDRPNLGTEYVAPTGEIERGLVEIWQELLGLSQVGVHDNFFELGGHSLLATQIVARVQKAFDVDLPLRAFTETPTPSEQAEVVRKLQGEGRAVPALTQAVEFVADPENLGEPFPLTDVQEAYWIGRSQVFQLGNVATHIYAEQDVEDLDLDRYERSWQKLVDRHDMMRAVFQPDGRQKILLEVPPFTIERIDLSGLDPEEQERRLLELRASMSHQVRPVEEWPIYEIRASILGNGRFRLHVSFDFLIFDAWSFEIVAKEQALLYHNPEAELPPIDISFRDYVLAEERLRQTEVFRRARQYWLDRVATLPPAPELPLAVNPAEVRSPRFVGRNAVLPRAKWNLLKQRAERRGLTGTAFLAAVFSEVLAKWCKTPRFTMNLTLFNRLPLHPHVDRILGDFSSLSLLGVEHQWGDTFDERARRLQVQLWDDLDHRVFSGVRVMRELARARGSLASAIMPVVFTSTLGLVQQEQAQAPSAPKACDPNAKADALADGSADASTAASAEDETVDLDKMGFRISQTPQVWLDHQVTELRGDLTIYWDAVEELFEPGVLDAMFAANLAILHALAEDEVTWSRRRFDLLPAEQTALFAAANETAAELTLAEEAPPERLHDLFARRLAERSNAPAVIAPDRTLTYAEVDALANRLAHRLRALAADASGETAVDLGAETLVGVVLEKGWRQVPAVLGVLRAGASYLPIDPSLPAERLAFLFDHAGASLAVTDAALDAALAEDERWPAGVVRVRLEEDELAGESSDLDSDLAAAAASQSADDLAYVIYTSGSTGQPKGVAIDHGAAINTIVDILDRFSIGPDDRVLALSALNFDLSVYDVFGTLGSGGAIVLPPPGAGRDPATWAKLVEEQKVTTWNTVPALAQMLVEYAEGRDGVDLTSLRVCLMSGDWIPVALPDRLRALAPNLSVNSLGGATEASIWSILYPIEEVDPDWPSIPYGKPLRNQGFHVLDGDLEPCPTWVQGQLYISGVGLARGYWNDPEKTAASFFEHPRTGERLYRTGDLGRRLPSGDIEFLGREDFQVKIQGYRIELGEIEAALSEHPAVLSCVVAALGEDRTNKRLAAYVVPTPGAKPEAALDATALAEFLAQKLPAYMVPPSFTTLDRLPLTANGKVDRQALPEPSGTGAGSSQSAGRASAGASSGPTSASDARAEIAAKVHAVIGETFGLDRVDPSANLLELGATSIEIIKIATRLHKELGGHPEMEELFTLENIDALVTFYERALPAARDKATGAAASTATPSADPYAEWYEVIFDEDERERFKKEKRWHRDLAERPTVRLAGTENVENPADLEPWVARRSVRRFSKEPIALESLAGLLEPLRVARVDGAAKWRYASAGTAYPVQTYLVVAEGRVDGLAGGSYYYDPETHRLVELHAGATIDRSVHGFINWSIFQESAFSIFLVADIAAIGPLYGPVAKDYCLLEAGIVSQVLDDAAVENDLGLCHIGVGGVDLEPILPLFDLDESHLCVHSLLGGELDPSLTPAESSAAAPIFDEWEEGEL